MSQPQPLPCPEAPIQRPSQAQLPPCPEASVPTDKEDSTVQRTSDYYKVDETLPARFNYPGWFNGYRPKERNPLYRTTNMDYGGKPPTVHEMPTCYHVTQHTFTDTMAQFGMPKNSGINTALEKSDVTGPDNFINIFDTLDFHPSYRTGGPSICE